MGSSGGWTPPPPSAQRADGYSLPLLLLPGTADFVLTWSEGPMPVDTYATHVNLQTLLGKGTASVVGVSAAAVTLRVTNTALIALGTIVYVSAWS